MKIKDYIPLAEFISNLLGINSEVVVHDFSNIDQSIIYISNGYITNRKVGDTITDFILKKFLEDSKGEKHGFLANYASKNYNGKILNSSTCFIYDNDILVGSICVNSDFEKYHNAIEILHSILPNSYIKPNNLTQEVKENFYNNENSLSLNKIEDQIMKSSIEPSRMTPEEKKNVVEALYKDGLFLLKGSVTETAVKLRTSEATIYRYIREIKNKL